MLCLMVSMWLCKQLSPSVPKRTCECENSVATGHWQVNMYVCVHIIQNTTVIYKHKDYEVMFSFQNETWYLWVELFQALWLQLSSPLHLGLWNYNPSESLPSFSFFFQSFFLLFLSKLTSSQEITRFYIGTCFVSFLFFFLPSV